MVSRQLTILQMLPALESGGVERGTLEVGKFLVEQGHRSLVMSAGGRMVEQLVREGSEHFAWPVGRKSLWTLRLVRALRRFLAEQQVDVLHARSRMPAWVAYLAWKGMNPATRPHLVTTVHGFYAVGWYSAVMMRGERVIAVSEAIHQYILANYPKTECARIRLIPRGVDRAEFPHGYQPPSAWLNAWNGKFPQLTGKRVLTLPGRLTRLKGHDDFIDLVGHMKSRGLPVHGLIVGGESPKRKGYARYLREKVAKNHLQDAITFTGQRADLREVMAVSDIVFSLSSQPESFGRTTLEALALGVPVIGYAHGGVAEVLSRMFPQGAVGVGDLSEAENRTAQLLASNSDVPPNQDFLLETMLERTLEVYRELVVADHRNATSHG